MSNAARNVERLDQQVKGAAKELRHLAEQLPDTPGPLLPAMAVREWLLQHADAITGTLPGRPAVPTAAIDPAQLDGLRHSLWIGFQDSEVVAAYDADGNHTDDWATATVEEAQRMAEVAMTAITHTVGL